jgi:C4-dicarboxylate transporter, DctQ subunit
MKPFWSFFDRLIDGMAALAGAVLVFITVAVCYTIGMRFLFTQTTIWIMQTTEYGLLWIVFLATTWLLREKGHICTDILYARLDGRAQQILDSIMFSIAGIVCAIMAFLASLYVGECVAHRVTDVRAVTVPKSIIFCIIPIGSTCLTIQFFRMAWRRFMDVRAGS